MTNYQAALARIKKANTETDLNKLDESFERIYNAGQFSVSEYSRLCVKIMEKLAKLEGNNF